MKAVMISIQPKWVEKIANGEKTIEVRKTAPKIETPFKCYIYKTKKRILRDITKKGELGYYAETSDKVRIISCPDLDGGKVIGEFVCDRILKYECSSTGFGELATTCGTCLTYDDIINYCNGQDLYGWHISDLKIYDKPKELRRFFTPLGKRPSYQIERPPQSWYYVEE